MKVKILLLLIILFSKTQAQNNINETIYCNFKDSRGLIWLGAESGIYLYQGNTYHKYENEKTDTNSLTSGLIYTIAEDGYGNIWAASLNNGFTIFNPTNNFYKNFTPASFSKLLYNNTINTVVMVNKDTMLFNTTNGAYYVHAKNYSITDALPTEYKTESIIYKKHNHKSYFLLQGKGILELNRNGEYNLIPIPSSNTNMLGMNVVNNVLYVSGYSGLYSLKDKILRKVNCMYNGIEIGTSGINDVLGGPNGTLYVNSLREGLLETTYKNNRLECKKLKNNLLYQPGQTIYSNTYDESSKQFLIGSQSGLLTAKTEAHAFHSIGFSGLKPGIIWAILATNTDLYIGAENGLFLNGNAVTNQLSSKQTINDLFRLPNGTIYGISNFCLESKDRNFKKLEPLSKHLQNSNTPNFGNAINDSIIYVIKFNENKLYFLNIKSNVLQEYALDIPTSSLNIGSVVFQNKIIINTWNGLYAFDFNTKKLNRITTIKDKQIIDLKSHNGYLYFSSAHNGISCYDKDFKKVFNIDLSEQVGNNNVRSILILNNNIWFATANKVGYCDISSKLIKLFEAGLVENNFCQRAISANKNKIYFGATNNIVVCNTEKLLSNSDIKRVYLLNISLLKNSILTKVPNPETYHYRHNENNIVMSLAMEYNGLTNFSNLEYQINDQEKIPVELNGEIKMYSLAPSNYTIKIFSRQSNKILGKYTFIVSPPWYQSLWFKLSLIALALTLTFFMSRSYLKRKLVEKEQLLDKQLALQEERNRIASDMHDDIGSKLSSILMQSALLRNKYIDEDSQKKLMAISEETSSLTNSMKEMVWSLNSRNDSLPALIQHLQSYAQKFLEPSNKNLKVNFNIDTIPDLVVGGIIRKNILLFYKELLNNILKHSKASQVIINISFEKNILKINVADNGIGIPNENMEGNGLYTMQKRLKDIGGAVRWQNTNPGVTTNMEWPYQ